MAKLDCQADWDLLGHARGMRCNVGQVSGSLTHRVTIPDQPVCAACGGGERASSSVGVGALLLYTRLPLVSASSSSSSPPPYPSTLPHSRPYSHSIIRATASPIPASTADTWNPDPATHRAPDRDRSSSQSTSSVTFPIQGPPALAHNLPTFQTPITNTAKPLSE